MTEKEKVISLYNYISEVSKNSKSICKNISKEVWFYFLEALPKDDNIIVNNFNDEENDIILEIRKPNLLKPLEIEKNLLPWLEGNWDNYKENISIKKEIVVQENNKASKTITIDKALKDKLDRKIVQRDIWVEKQKSIEAVRKIFDSLYIKYLELDKDDENLEILLANGMLKIVNADIYYPILLKKVKLKFDAAKNIIRVMRIEDSDQYISQLYFDFLGECDLDTVNINAILPLEEKVKEENIYPLDGNTTSNFFREFIHRLSKDGQYAKDIENLATISSSSIIIENKPLLFVRKKRSGITKAVNEIIKNIEETQEVPSQLCELVGLKDIKDYEKYVESNNSNCIAPQEILFVKDTNNEQIEIAEKIEKNNAVVVQGPPGTGKTHTIANLLGHFLSQGKNVLVTSHTKKALKVLKDKIPKNIQGLCISVLDDDNSDMSRSVESITENMARLTSDTLKKEVDRLENARNLEYKELKKIKDKIFAITYKESQVIVYNGESFSIKTLGAYLRENDKKLNLIKGEVTSDTPCPITNEEFRFLKEYREYVSSDEEKELKSNLPDIEIFKSKEEFENILHNLQVANENFVNTLPENHNSKSYSIIDENLVINSKRKINLKTFENSKLKENLIPEKLKDIENWQLDLIQIGYDNGNKKLLWNNFLEQLKKDSLNIGEKMLTLFGKDIKSNVDDVQGEKLVEELKEGILNPGFLFKSKLKKAKANIENKVLLNGKNLETIQECDILLDYYKINLQKEELKRKLESFGIGELNFNTIIDNPNRFIESVEYYLNWCEKSSPLFIENIKETGIDATLIIENPKHIKIDKLNNIIEKLEKYIEISHKGVALLKAKEKYKEYADFIGENVKQNSAVEREILEGISSKNIDKYAKGLEKLASLLGKYKYHTQKQEILGKIKKVALVWYDQLKNEKFNMDVVDIYEVWKYKQLCQKLDELEKEPYENLKKLERKKKKEIKKLTLELVEKKSWYHILSFVERKENLLISQALRGWKLSIEKIGKGTGKNADKYRKEAKEKFAVCQKAIPVWIMPMNKVIDTLNPAKNRFDIVIIDEASQCDLTSLVLLYMAKKVIVVGDHKQVSPSAIGSKIEKENLLIDKYLKGKIVNHDLYTMKSSLYAIASTTYQPLMLREHFRCVPEIIAYSNKTSYDYKIKPLREANSSKIKPAVVNYRVDGVRSENKDKINVVEAETIVSLMMACMEEKVYANSSFGAISLLGSEQASLILKLIVEKIEPSKIEKHQILCGDSSTFQGDEKDIIFLSMVDSNENSAKAVTNYEESDLINRVNLSHLKLLAFEVGASFLSFLTSLKFQIAKLF